MKVEKLGVRAENCISSVFNWDREYPNSDKGWESERNKILESITKGALSDPRQPRPKNYGLKTYLEICRWLGVKPKPYKKLVRKKVIQQCRHCGGTGFVRVWKYLKK